MKPGDKMRVQETMWSDAFGNDYTLAEGEMLTIKDIRNICGQRFLSFEHHPETYFFWSVGFTSLKSYH